MESGPIVKQKIRKPARCQLDPSEVFEKSKPDQTGQVFNIWYSKWSGGDNNGKRSFEHAKHRCDIERDSGYTKADKNTEPNSINKNHYFCLYFARGYCCNGKNCEYLHRIPTEFDIFSPTVDCFGREKFMDYRDDMSGIGSFGRVNKTLYVGNISSVKGNIEMQVYKSFSEFGDIDSVKILQDKHVAFVKFKLESQAQFAKEAMYCQSLVPGNNSEVLNIRWSNKDPFGEGKRKLEQDELSMDAARKLLQRLKQENSRKKQKITVTDVTEEEDIDLVAGVESGKTEKVEINLEGLDMLKKQRAKRLANNCLQNLGLLKGYSSDEDN